MISASSERSTQAQYVYAALIALSRTNGQSALPVYNAPISGDNKMAITMQT